MTGYGLAGAMGLGTWAALKLGGEYIAHAAPWMLRRGPLRLAAGVLGIGAEGVAAHSSVLKAFGMGNGLRGVVGMNETRGMLGVGLGAGKSGALRGALGDLGYVFDQLGAKALVSKTGLLLMGETLAKLGLRAIPVVGEILGVVQILQFLGSHSFSIGKLVGEGAHLLVNGLVYAWNGITNFFGSLVKFILGGPGVWMHGASSFFSSIGGSIMNGVRGVQAGWNAVGAHPPAHKVAHLASGGYTRSDGLAYLHKRELVVNAPLTKRLDALTRGRGRGNDGQSVVFSFGDIVISGDTSTRSARRIAAEIADKFAKVLRLDGSGSNIMGAGFSSYELVGGMS